MKTKAINTIARAKATELAKTARVHYLHQLAAEAEIVEATWSQDKAKAALKETLHLMAAELLNSGAAAAAIDKACKRLICTIFA